jgi:hypothetical protein
MQSHPVQRGLSCANALLAEFARLGLEALEARLALSTRHAQRMDQGHTLEGRLRTSIVRSFSKNRRGTEVEAAPGIDSQLIPSAAKKGVEPWLQFATLSTARLCPYLS